MENQLQYPMAHYINWVAIVKRGERRDEMSEKRPQKCDNARGETYRADRRLE